MLERLFTYIPQALFYASAFLVFLAWKEYVEHSVLDVILSPRYLMLIAIGIAAYIILREFAQRERDHNAKILFDSILEGSPIDKFCVYLRPGVSTDLLTFRPGSDGGSLVAPVPLSSSELEFEEAINSLCLRIIHTMRFQISSRPMKTLPNLKRS